MIIDLRKPDLRDCLLDDVVITSKGFEFKLITRDVSGKESWKDLTSGLIWHDIEDHQYNYEEAIEKFETRLPTIEEFEKAEEHGFREVIPNMDNWFWSASLFPYYKYYARVFFGYFGFSYYFYRGFVNSVRCVGR